MNIIKKEGVISLGTTSRLMIFCLSIFVGLCFVFLNSSKANAGDCTWDASSSTDPNTMSNIDNWDSKIRVATH